MLALHIISAIALIAWTIGGGIYLVKRFKKAKESKAAKDKNKHKESNYDEQAMARKFER